MSKMNMLRKVFVLVMVAAVLLLSVPGCGGKSDSPSGEHPSGEHPSGEKESEKTPSEEHPSGEHPSGEHPK
jgi:hypothetical protein